MREAVSTAAMAAARTGWIESNAPHLISDSMTPLLTTRRSTRSQKSKSDLYGLSLREPVSHRRFLPRRHDRLHRLSPTPLIAARPKRIAASPFVIRPR